LEGEKVVRRVICACLLNGKRITGYEIHMGRTRLLTQDGKPFLNIYEPGKRRAWEDGCFVEQGRTLGTYVHGLLDSPSFRADLLNRIRKAKGLDEMPPKRGRLARFHQYDRRADHF